MAGAFSDGSYYTGSVYIFYNDGSIPTTAATADVIISGETTDNYFFSVTAGDFNTDGRTDLVVGAWKNDSSTGRAYIFYNDGSYPTNAVSADVIISGETTNTRLGGSFVAGDFNSDGKMDLAVGAYQYGPYAGRTYICYSQNGMVNTNRNITGEASSQFGNSMTTGDFNVDGKTDLAVGAKVYSSNTGRVYIFYNDSSIPTTAATADVIIDGETTNNYFGSTLVSGDFNADGKTDFAAGAYGYSSGAGRAYIFHSDGSIPTAAVSADVVINGESSSTFCLSVVPGDFNADGKTDLAVGAQGYSGSTGRAYIFYNDGSIPTSAASADVIIGGEFSSLFGTTLASGDYNADGRSDLAVSAPWAASDAGRVYIFYNDGSIPTTVATADVTIDGESFCMFGNLLSGDFNSDGKTDLVASATRFSSFTGRVYIFYNDGSYPSVAASADVVITGSSSSNEFGNTFVANDFNADGKTDLAVGESGYSAGAGRIYFYETRENFAWQLQTSGIAGSLRISPSTAGQEMKISGETTDSYFGSSFAAGDFNADGKTDLAVGGTYRFSGKSGRVYIFYTDGSLASSALSADVIIFGEESSNFGYSMTAGDFDANGKIDLAVGASDINNSGRAYIFYNDGSYPTSAVSADVMIDGAATFDYFASSLIAADLNADGRTDIAVGASGYSSYTGRVYIFSNDGSYPSIASASDIIIDGETSSQFGSALALGDFNADGRTDIAVGAPGYSSNTGRVYIFSNDGSIPVTAASADITITGESSNNNFGNAVTADDFNSDGKADLAVGAWGYGMYIGRIYIFYDDGAYPTSAASADVIITGDTGQFGTCLIPGDFNSDGRADLAASAFSSSTERGRTYLFYNDGSIPTSAVSADVIITGETEGGYSGFTLASGDFNSDGKADLVIGAYGYLTQTGRAYLYTFNDKVGTGEASSNNFGYAMTAGDFNSDGKTDLAVGAYGYGSSAGRAYVFYDTNNGIINPSSADVTITGEASSKFGISFAQGDFNSDGRTDLVAGALDYSASTGRAYIFYNDGSIPTTAASADIKITGETSDSLFGYSLAAGDFNADGKTDLAVGAWTYASDAGRTYIFYSDGSIPTTAASADVTITGEASSLFGITLASGDFDVDGKMDLVVGADAYSSDAGRAYIFYQNSGGGFTTPMLATSASVIITGETSSNFGYPLVAGDFNTDGKTDLAVGTDSSSLSTGRAYIFYNDGSISTTAASADETITGEASSHFGATLTSGDFNADGKTDLAVGAREHSSNTGRAYLFYNDGSIPTTATTADVIMTGEAAGDYYGVSFASGDLNFDGKTDLAVGAYGYSSDAGRVYVIMTEARASNPTGEAARTRGPVKVRGPVRIR